MNVHDAAAAAHRALCELEDVLDGLAFEGQTLDQYELSAVYRVERRWDVDTLPKIEAATRQAASKGVGKLDVPVIP